MLGTIAHERIHDLLRVLAEGDAPGVMQRVAELAELAPDFAGVLQELLALLHRVALLQAVPDALDESTGDGEQVAALAAQLAPADVQLFYQIGLIGQRDLPLAPDPRSGLEMVLLRMLAFRPESVPVAGGGTTPSSAQRSVPAGSAGKAPASERPPVTAKPEAAAKPAAAAPDLSRWGEVVASLRLGGVASQLAANCTFGAWDGTLLTLQLDPEHRHLQVGSAEQRLAKALERFLGTPVKLLIQVGATTQGATPAQQQAQAQAQRQQAAEAGIAADPLVQAVQERFGAQIAPGSVRVLDPE
jgi:DNA polymerase-3 subunit gamma/tau